jgi:hypothetical protein
MSAQTKCSHCEPPGSGQCAGCQTLGRSGNSKCSMCYGSGTCRYCNGTGLAMSTLDRCKDMLLSVWWISWFGIIGAFLTVGVWEYKTTLPQGSASRRFSLMLLIVTSFLWIVFYRVEEKAREKVDGARNKLVVVDLLTVAGTFLAVFTLLGIFFFTYIAPHVQ